jgi:hypothetical protein
MELIDDPQILARAQATFDLYRTAKVIMRQNLRRRHPGETEEEIEARLRAWLRKDPPLDGRSEAA